ncbi:MAG: PEP-CTERM sorting domain-containing protein [Lacipirellulaceae bacterium]
MRLHRLALALVASIGWSASALAQSPGVLYTWDHAFGAGAGANTEGWSFGFGSNAGTTVSNGTDGVLTITEASAGLDWAVTDGFNNYKESAARSNLGGAFAIGGADFLGLDGLEFDIQHNGTGAINGQVFLQPDDGSGCCAFRTQPITVNPGGPQTLSVDLNAFGLTPGEFKYVRAMGIQIFGNAEAAPLTWQLSEIRSTGTPLTTRVIADHTTGSLQNAVVKFDNTGINGSTGTDNQVGLQNLGDGLRWVDLANGPGGAVAWGNGNVQAVGYGSRTMDLSNYDFATVRMRATGGAGADPTLNVQFYAQHADRADNNEFDFQSIDLVLPVDGQFYDLVFPISAFVDKDLTQWIGLNLQTHAGNMDIRVASVVLSQIPEPASMVIMSLGAVCGLGLRRRA